jgi:hypothetical protein
LNEQCGSCRIGDLATGLDLKRSLKVLNISKTTASACKACWALGLCFLCVRHSMQGNRIDARARERMCLEARRIVDHNLCDYVVLKSMGGV